VEADPKNLKAHWYVVWFLSQKKDAAGAQKELDALLAKDADYPYAFKLRGEWKAAAGDLAGAIEDSKTALAKETERAKAESREEDAAILQQLDMYLFRLGEEKREYDQAIQGYTDALKDRKAPGNVLANFALTLRNAGKYAESEKQYLAAAAASPDEAEVYNDLGLLYEAQGKLVDAEAQYRKAIEVGGSVESIENLGKLFFRLGSYRNALRQFGRLLDREPSRPGAMFYYHLSRRALERASASGAGHAGHGH
jgi:tetratricopeptide (TPR) repeat protein